MLKRTFLKVDKSDWFLKIVERLSDGITAAKANHYDLVLLDLSLPDSDGLDTVGSFINSVPNIPVIVLTIASDENLALAAIGRGAQDYLIKGEITPTLLVRSIRYGIERGQLVRQIVQSNADLEAFNFLMAHDLQTPLRTITSFSQAVIEDYAHQLDDTAKDYLQRSIRAASRLNTLIKDLLTYSRVGYSEIRLQKVELSKAVDEVIKEIETLSKEARAEITTEQLSFAVKAHQNISIQVILNLVTNAIKFVAPDTKPQIRIWAERRNNWIRLWVEDNGIGIDPEDREKIFDVFIRLHGIQSYPGTGVGLAFVKRAIERFQGRVGVESQLGQGSKFWLELPEFTAE